MKLTGQERALIQNCVGASKPTNAAQMKAAFELLTKAQFTPEESSDITKLAEAAAKARGSETPGAKDISDTIGQMNETEIDLSVEAEVYLSWVIHGMVGSGQFTGFNTLIVAPLLDKLPAPPASQQPAQPAANPPGGVRNAPPSHTFAPQ